MAKYDESSFFSETAALFDACTAPQRTPDHVSRSGSKYWYTASGVIRDSDHWGYCVASCSWYIRDLDMRYAEVIDEWGILDRAGKCRIAAYCPFDGFQDVHEFRRRWTRERLRSVDFVVNRMFEGGSAGS